MEKFEDNKTPLPETDLEEVAGGTLPHGENIHCYFTPEGLSKRNASGIRWAKCSANCYGHGFGKCACHGKAHCVDKWHRMTDDGELFPRDGGKGTANHLAKLRKNNFASK